MRDILLLSCRESPVPLLLQSTDSGMSVRLELPFVHPCSRCDKHTPSVRLSLPCTKLQFPLLCSN